ncbi:MAG: COX15/CtaA family protein [Persicimonas sp.]
MSQKPKQSKGFTAYAWTFVGYLMAVILFGAWVRITHSGAGCGDHWPTCHGDFVPFAPSVETMIEYTHRLTSGFLGILGLVLVGWAAKLFGARHRVFWAAVVTLLFIIFEALIGAGIVLAELVTDDDSVARAVVISIHLLNTLTLSGAAALTAWWSSGKPLPQWSDAKKSLQWLLGLSVVGLVITSMSGAVTALGDTLFPVDPTVGGGLFDRVRGDLSPAKHFLVRLRIIHPVIAVLTSVFLVAVTTIVRTSEVSDTAKKASIYVLVFVIGQVIIGIVNIYLGAPGWIQLVHLGLAQTVWIAVLIMGNEALQKVRKLES